MFICDEPLTKKLSPSLDTAPFIRWPGGKRWLVPKMKKILRGLRFKRYFEPFLGGGAFYFSFTPGPAVLSDINKDLVNTYIHVRDHAEQLVAELQRLAINKATYETFRETTFESSFYRAVRFLYLNRTGFSGIYRVNAKGNFNVPYGGGDRTLIPLLKNNLLLRASKALQGTRIVCADFDDLIVEAKDGDLLYCDPIYTVSHNNNGFRRYNESVFSWEDQERLGKACQAAARRGCTVIVSNAFHHEIRNVYSGAEIYTFKRWSGLSSNPNKRKPRDEYLFIWRQ
jgi:DNA adenine methylase